MIKRLLSFVVFYTALFSTIAQEQDWVLMMNDSETNFYEVQDAFDAYWSKAEHGKGKGFKPYKRWEYWMEQRCFPSGDMPDRNLVMEEMEKVKKRAATTKSMESVDWTYFGNTSVPSNGGGAGRINGVRHVNGSATTWYACAPAGGLWKTTNAGTSWTMWNTDFLSSIGCTDLAIHPTNANIMYLATGDGDASDTYSLGVLKSIDGGINWIPTGLNWTIQQNRTINRLLINPSNPDILFAFTSNGVYRTADAGVTWTLVQSGNFKDGALKPGDSNTVYGTQYGSQFWRSSNGGVSFTQVTSGLPASGIIRSSLAVTEANSSYLYILMANNSNYGFQGVYRSTDSGLNFTQMATTPNLLGWSEIGGDSGGQGWYDLSICASPSDANDIFVGGVNVWRSTNGGSTWTCAGHWYGANGLPYVHADIHFMGFIPGTSTLLVGNDGGVFRSIDGGNTFSDRSSNLQVSQQYRLGTAATNENRVITGWQDNGTNLKNTAAWSQVIGGDGMECAISQTNQNIMFGSLYYGWILRSTNGGGSFNTIVNSGGGGIDANGAWVTPYLISPNASTTLYVGKERVYRSTDNGSTWTELGAIGGSNCNALAVAKSNENFIYASKGGTLYRSTDGSTFNTAPGLPGLYITYIAVDPINEQRVWVTFSGYSDGLKIYYSANGGTTWSNYSDGLDNIPANCIVYQQAANDLLYVGTDAGVFYRDSNMAQWELYGNALPFTPVSELEVHYASNRLVASTYGRGLWRIPTYTAPDLDVSALEVLSPAGTYCGSSVSPVIRFGNNANTPITAINFSYGVQGGSVLNQVWNGNLTTGNTVDVALPEMDNGSGAFVFYAQIMSVNGAGPDENTANDYVSGNYISILAENSVTLTLNTDCWGNESSWDLRDENNNVLFEGSGYASNAEFNETLCLPNGCFTFNMYDSYGDGLNGQAFGCAINGNYVMTNDATGDVVFQMINSDFGFGISHSFCLPVICFEPVVSATAPISVSGLYVHTTASNSGWGGAIGFPSVSGTGVWVNDGSGSPTLGCGALNNGAQLNGNIAVALRGTCNFSSKAINAQNAGAMALIIINNVAGAPVEMAAGANAGDVTIPVVMISQADGNALTPFINSGTLEMFIGNDCEEVGVEGCTNLLACNYNIDATLDDGTCTFPGCSNQSACNYDSTAGCDDGTCTYPGCTDPLSCDYSPTAGCNDGSCTYSGCTNPAACNYNANAGCDNGTCTFPGCLDVLACNFSVDAGCSDGTCTYSGCTNPIACNYNIQAGCDDGSCSLPVYFESFNDGNFTAAPVWSGDQGSWLVALSASSGANSSNSSSLRLNHGTGVAGSQYLSTPYGDWQNGQEWSFWLGRRAQAYSAANNVSVWLFADIATLESGTINGYRVQIGDDTGGDEFRLQRVNGNTVTTLITSASIANGLTDHSSHVRVVRTFDGQWNMYTGALPSTSGQGPTANSCVVANTLQGSASDLGITPSGAGFMGIVAVHGSGTNSRQAAEFDNLTIVPISVPVGCTNPAACNFDFNALMDDNSCSFPGCTDPGACNFNASAGCLDESCEYLSCAGCTDGGACNFDGTATIDNGSCTYPGCSDPEACNYNSLAGCADGSCDYTSCLSCFGDFDGNGVVSFSDLNVLISQYGCLSNCSADLNGDDIINFNDLSIFLTNYGVVCP